MANPTIKDVISQLTSIDEKVETMLGSIRIKSSQVDVFELSELTESLGMIQTGEFRVGNFNDPGDGFTGVRIAYPAMSYDSEEWNIVGVNADVMQFGVRASDGKLVAGGGAVVLDSGGITAVGGEIGGWTISSDALYNGAVSLNGVTGTITVNDTDVILDSDGITAVAGTIAGIELDTGGIQSPDYSAGTQGFRITNGGDAEFNNITARGSIRTAVFMQDELHINAGQLGVFKSGGKLLNDVTYDGSSPTMTWDIEDPESGHATVFDTDDIIRVKDGFANWWIKVSSITDNTTYYSYTGLVMSALSGTIMAGTGVADYGVSGDGYLVMSADTDNSPFYSVRTHNGTPWNSTGNTEVARLGNLNGYLGYSTDVYGLGMNAGRIKAGEGDVTIDSDGIVLNGDADSDNTTHRIRWESSDGYAEIHAYSHPISNTIAYEQSAIATDSTFDVQYELDVMGDAGALLGFQARNTILDVGAGIIVASSDNIFSSYSEVQAWADRVQFRSAFTGSDYAYLFNVADKLTEIPITTALILESPDTDHTMLMTDTDGNLRQKLSDATVGNLLGGVPTGATVPTNPIEGDLFLHLSTDGDILKQYVDSDWTKIHSGETLRLIEQSSVPSSPASGSLLYQKKTPVFHRSDGGKIPVVPCPPWSFFAKGIHLVGSSYNPTMQFHQTMIDEGYYARHLSPQTSWTGALEMNSNNTILSNIPYYGINASNTYYENVTNGNAIDGRDWVTMLMWFYPTSGGALRGLFQFGAITLNMCGYFTSANKVVMDIYNSSGTLYQVISSNTVNFNQWNCVVFRYGTTHMFVELNGTRTFLGTTPTGVLRSASGAFRLGWQASAGGMYGCLGWTYFTHHQSDQLINYLIDISRPWHGH